MYNPAYDPQNLLLAQQLPVQVPAALDASGQPVAVPSTVTTTRNPVQNTSDTRIVESPRMKAADEAIKQGAEAEKGIVQAKTGVAVAQEAIQATGAQDEANQRSRYEVERDALKEVVDKRIAQSIADQKAARAEMVKQKPTTYMEDLSPIRKALTALSLGLGSFGASQTGGPNTAFQIYQSFEQADRAKKEDALKLKASRLADTTGDIKAAQDFYTNGMLGIQNREMARLQYFKSTVEAQIKRVPQAAINGEAELNKINQSAAEKEMKQAQFLADQRRVENEGQVVSEQVTRSDKGGSEKPAPQFDKTIAMHARVMDRAITQFESRPPLSPEALVVAQKNEALLNGAIEDAKTVKGAMVVNFLRDWSMVPKSATEGLSQNDKVKLLNMEAINKSWLRVVSGAAIGKEEKEQNAQELTLRPGDEGEVLKWKLQEIKARTADMMALSGGAGRQAEAANPQGAASLEPPPALKPGEVPTAPGQAPAQKRYTAEVARQIETDRKTGTTTAPAPMKLDAATRTRLGEAQKVKRGDPDYAEAQAYIKKVRASRGGN